MKIIRLKILFILFAFCFFNVLYGGEYAADFLNIGVGARALGMGGAACASIDDGSSFYWNPAGLGFLKTPVLSGMYGPQFGSLKNPLGNYHFIGYSQPLPGKAVISINWIRLSVDEIPIYSGLEGESFWDRLHDLSIRPSGEPEGFITDTEDALFFTFAKYNRFKVDLGWQYHKVGIELPVGLNIKWIRQKLGDYEASGIGIDAGAMVRFRLDELVEKEKIGTVTFGLFFQDFTGTRLTWDTEHQDNLPMNIKWGIAYMAPLIFMKSELNISYNRESRWGGKNRWGLEFIGLNIISLRAGLDDGNFTCGAGLKIWRMDFDYAFLTHNLESLHRISCAISLKSRE